MEFHHDTLVDEERDGDAEDGGNPDALGAEPECLLHHLARVPIGLNEGVLLDVGGDARTSHCLRVVSLSFASR
eukprot:CAMPEP_0181381920 /NCGR_PEP_ID=MMETSP1106-20121128/20415_1 /TAXON_ID=81844 /ORGANISM="Mantoniella antarctica, Strain SL-175" /LENGTH=72 /DNA_ID=CAMNT_0023501209 /DNA_START=167 /DNA_END=381 /DNA_ORIENTATION=-